ncbi:MAG: hypothetical protein B6D61_05520 [Bacteroidetes bacterium 4484_249]|nr:MAG: hypothetical protein B6D61_05520 [Bacteroidetes bacterium 4484_249]
MFKLDNHMKEIPEELIIKRIMDKDLGLTHLNNLIRVSKLERSLLNIVSYEEATFIIDSNNTKQLSSPKFERLTLVYPPSFAFTLQIQISGYFNIKYKSASVSLPNRIEPFIANFSGIVIQNETGYEFRNESLIVQQ